MGFNSLLFAFFLAIVLPVYYALPWRWQNRFLVLASYVFYAAWDWRFLGLLLISTLVDFRVGLAIAGSGDEGARRRLLGLSLLVNLGILGFFKYFGFFADSLAVLLDGFGLVAPRPALDLILPVGISFYTFQTLAYTIDVYRRRETPTPNLVAFALYVAYFPQLVAGPIERSTHLLPQILKPRRVGQDQIASGAQLMLLGYFKKVAIADAVAPYVNVAFADPSSQGGLALLLALYLFAIQIYCDFSGYSDIARGISRLLGIELCINFKQPYLAANITEFWRRWHISLSSWLRDYLYISMGGNRGGRWKTYRNLMLTMLLGGLWHGASWNFVVWGGLHGLFLLIHKLLTGGRKIGLSEAPTNGRGWISFVLRTGLTFNLVCVTWIFFRADRFDLAWQYLVGLFAWGPMPSPALGFTFLFYALVLLLVDLPAWRRDDQTPFAGLSPALRGIAYAGMLLLLSFVGEVDGSSFIYFQF